MFESWVASEIFKAAIHRGLQPWMHHYRSAGTDVDLVVDSGSALILTEAKSGRTVAPRFFAGIRRLGSELQGAGFAVERRVVYGGDERQSRGDAEAVPWNRLLDVDW